MAGFRARSTLDPVTSIRASLLSGLPRLLRRERHLLSFGEGVPAAFPLGSLRESVLAGPGRFRVVELRPIGAGSFAAFGVRTRR